MRGYSTYSMELLASLYADCGNDTFTYNDLMKREGMNRSFFFTMLGKGAFVRVTKQMPRYINGERVHVPATYRLSEEFIRLIIGWKERQEKKKKETDLVIEPVTSIKPNMQVPNGNNGILNQPNLS